MENRSPNKVIKTKRRERSLLLQCLDSMIIKFLKATRSYGEVVISVVEIAVANVLVQRYPEYNLNHI